ncbi:MAG: glycine--tRNA ligase subunit alpha, partial [Anaerolineales bacterium]
MSQSHSFQSVVMQLEKFWADYGCLIWQPYNEKVGAGTMNPATTLRVLGPEPWNVAYVEPSIRPDDGRYGENPNRMQQHHQYQVILKPDPGDPQEVYLASLEAIGIDPREHDLRFVEDNWESPAIGAWGLGWEVWLDGQEITQFTYFQQAGGLQLDPVSVEITYGLDRILIALQRIQGFTEIKWNDEITAGDVNLQLEQEYSRYYFETADVERLRTLYNLYEAEAEAALQGGLVLPAYDYVLKCSHTFNILDTRGAIGVTERAGYFKRMRGLSRQVAETYVAQRQRLEFPLLEASSETESAATVAVEALPAPAADAAYLLEIGVEELPAADLDTLMEQIREKTPALLAAYRLPHGDIRVYGTPRRLAVLVDAIPPQQPDSEELVRGPAVKVAFDSDGEPTKAALGFARGKGVPVQDLERREMDGGEYAVASVRVE